MRKPVFFGGTKRVGERCEPCGRALNTATSGQTVRNCTACPRYRATEISCIYGVIRVVPREPAPLCGGVGFSFSVIRVCLKTVNTSKVMSFSVILRCSSLKYTKYSCVVSPYLTEKSLVIGHISSFQTDSQTNCERVIFLKKIFHLLCALVVVLMMTACQGKALPEGMDENALMEAGKDVMLLLVGGEYEQVHELLREDQREQFTVDDIRQVVTSQLDGAGVYKQIEDRMTTGQVIDGVHYGVAVLYCDFSEEDVLVRISFDEAWNLVGFSLDQD